MAEGKLNIGGFVTPEAERGLKVTNHAGYLGAFTREQANGAIPNGTRIRKAWGESGDTTPVGTGGVVLGSLDARDAVPLDLREKCGDFFYFVE